MTLPAWVPWRWLVGAVVLGAVVWQTGTGPFVTGFSTLDARTLVLGAGIAVLTTFACAWRWHLVAGGLGVGIRMPPRLPPATAASSSTWFSPAGSSATCTAASCTGAMPATPAARFAPSRGSGSPVRS